MFQGPEGETGSLKPSSRGMKPPGGGCSDLFGSPEEVVVSSVKTHRTASNIFGAADEPQNIQKRTNPPGGKDSGIFEGHKANTFRHLTNPPGGKTSNIFGSPQPINIARAHPNKPKDHIVLRDGGDVPKEPMQKATEDQRQQVEETSEREPQKNTKEPEPKINDHEPRLGPRPRSHNKVLNPPGGKSSLAFY